MKLTKDSIWKAGDAVKGKYCGLSFTGVLTDETRPTPDYKNIMFCIDLDTEIEVYGEKRTHVMISTNDGFNEVIAIAAYVDNKGVVHNPTTRVKTRSLDYVETVG